MQACRNRWMKPRVARNNAAMKILFLGDVMGRSGRAAITTHLPRLRAEWKLDFVVVNGENATSGMGLSGDHAKILLDAGADVVTLGDHAFDQKDMLSFIEKEPRIVRPMNYSKAAPGVGARVFTAPGGRKVLVAQVLGQVFMKRPFDDPFSALDAVLRQYPMGGQVAASLIDIHCEATSEKMATGHFCDGRASIVVGTHTPWRYYATHTRTAHQLTYLRCGACDQPRCRKHTSALMYSACDTKANKTITHANVRDATPHSPCASAQDCLMARQLRLCTDLVS